MQQPTSAAAPVLRQPDAWLLQPPRTQQQQLPACQDAVKLFCVPQAGMGAWVYQSWQQHLAPNIQVLPVELPGHGSRMREARLTDLVQLAAQAVDALEPHLRQGAYALFGHSMGAWIVWEMLQEVTRRGLPLPVRLFVSGNRAPSLCGAQHDVDPVRMHTLTPDKFWQHFKLRYEDNKHLEDPAMQSFVYPMLRDDFQMVETYQPSSPEAATSVRIIAVGGVLDKRYTREQVSAWSHHTRAALKEVWLENQGHNYIADFPPKLMQVLKQELSTGAAASGPQLHPAADSTPAAAPAAVADNGIEAAAGQATPEAEQLGQKQQSPSPWLACCFGP